MKQDICIGRHSNYLKYGKVDHGINEVCDCPQEDYFLFGLGVRSRHNKQVFYGVLVQYSKAGWAIFCGVSLLQSRRRIHHSKIDVGSLCEWGLIDLPLRAFNEGSPRPRVARAQKIIRLHPFLCSALSFPAALVYPLKGGLVNPLLRASNEHILIVRVPRARGRPGCPSSPIVGSPRATTSHLGIA